MYMWVCFVVVVDGGRAQQYPQLLVTTYVRVDEAFCVIRFVVVIVVHFYCVLLCSSPPSNHPSKHVAVIYSCSDSHPCISFWRLDYLVFAYWCLQYFDTKRYAFFYNIWDTNDGMNGMLYVAAAVLCSVVFYFILQFSDFFLWFFVCLYFIWLDFKEDFSEIGMWCDVMCFILGFFYFSIRANV